MKRTAACTLLAVTLGLAFSAQAPAHDGVHHADALDVGEPVPLSAIARPHRLPDGSLWVSKQVQRVLALRTAVFDGSEGTHEQAIVGEVVAPANTATQLSASQAGILASGPDGWPLVGQPVHAGDTLAWLRPVLLQRDRDRRTARVADLDQKIAIAQLNMDRISLQNQANQGQVATGNIYVEQATADLRVLQQQRDLIAGGLSERIAVTAPVDGRIAAIAGAPGRATSAGQVIFELLGTQGMRVAATVFDPGIASQLVSATLQETGGAERPLRYRALEALSDRPGWRMWFDLDDAGTAPVLGLGDAVSIRLVSRTGAPDYVNACVIRGVQTAGVVWVHVAPEQFVATPATGCGGNAPLAKGARIVVAGATLLSRY